MLANPAVIARRSVPANVLSASTAKTSGFHVSIRTGNGIERRSTSFQKRKPKKQRSHVFFRKLGSLAGQVTDYERLLKDLSMRVGTEDLELIQKALNKGQSSDDDLPQSTESSRGRQQIPGEEKASARVGSIESTDRINEDFNKGPNVRATGFYGKSSELTWMQRLRTQMSSSDSNDTDESKEDMVDDAAPQYPRSRHDGKTLTPISATSYHCDDLSVLPQDDVDRFEVPNKAIGDALFQSYLNTVHWSFPIIGKTTFVQQYNVYYRRPESRPNPNWLAILNLIFAIGAKYSHITRAEWRGDSRDHLIYFTRARMLGLSTDAILGHADLQKVQITGLMSFYLMATNQINRSWTMSGIALRHACTLGLNLRNESVDVTETSKEIRCRLWWAVYSIERLLAAMTGRPTSFAEKDCTTPLPFPVEEDFFLGSGTPKPQVLQMMRRWSQQGDSVTTTPSTESSMKTSSLGSLSPATKAPPSQDLTQSFPPCDALAFAYHIRLSQFTNEVLIRLYCADGISEPWAHVQSTIKSLNARLEDWRQKLPPVFDFTRQRQDSQYLSHRGSLGFFYYSTLIIINRPCLCRVDRSIPHESDESRNYNRESAETCVHAACGMLNLLPDEPNAATFYKISPWFCLVHLLMQAATVCMLELSFRADHMHGEIDEVFASATKALQWLQNMAQGDEAARRASIVCNELLRQVVSKVSKTPKEALHFETGGDHDHPIQSIADMQSERSSAIGHRGQGGFEKMSGEVDGIPNQENVTMQPMQNLPTGHPGYQDLQNPQNEPSSQSAYPPRTYNTPVSFEPQLFSSYDQIYPYGQVPPPSATAAFDDPFLTAMDMEGMEFNEGDFPTYTQE
ncbi:hypothetical protein ACLMJK_008941 [Lecanora helva]